VREDWLSLLEFEDSDQKSKSVILRSLCIALLNWISRV